MPTFGVPGHSSRLPLPLPVVCLHVSTGFGCGSYGVAVESPRCSRVHGQYRPLQKGSKGPAPRTDPPPPSSRTALPSGGASSHTSIPFRLQGFAKLCKGVRCVLVISSSIHDVIGMEVKNYAACLRRMLPTLQRFPGLVVWKNACDAHRHVFSRGVCSVQFMTHDRIAQFNEVAAQTFAGRVRVLDTYNITAASLGLQTNDVRHYVPFVNKAMVDQLLGMLDQPQPLFGGAKE